jgi:hypothetical protein
VKRLKKASLSVWLTALLALCAISQAWSADFYLNFYNSTKQRRFEQSTNYAFYLAPDWQMAFNGKNLEDRRLDFNQISRNNAINVSLFRIGNNISHYFRSGFESLTDHSSLESELQPYENNTAFLGYQTRMTPLDSLYLETDIRAFYRREQDRYRASHRFYSKGLLERVSTGWFTGTPDYFLQLNGSLENKKLNWEAFRNASAGISSALNNDKLSANCEVNAAYRSEDLFILENPLAADDPGRYVKYDSQQKRYLAANLDLQYPTDGQLKCELLQSYTLNAIRHRDNQARNSGDYNNLSQLNFSYQLSDNTTLHSANGYNYYIKDLSHINNTRIIDVRNSGLGAAWEYVPNDSILFDYTIELRRTLYPDNGHKLDNDFLSTTWKFGWIMFWKERIRFANRFLYTGKQEVFINSSLSAYNNSIRGYQWQPECDVLLGDCLLLHQDYQLRADYDNYKYHEFSSVKDTFYRKVAASYNLVYDNSPLALKLTQPNWITLPFRNRIQDAKRVEMLFSWERTETADKNGNIYNLNGTDTRQIASLTLQQQLGMAIFLLQPKYTWGSWKEYSLLISAALHLNRDSVAQFNVNPIGPDFDNLDWRLYCSVNLMF